MINSIQYATICQCVKTLKSNGFGALIIDNLPMEQTKNPQIAQIHTDLPGIKKNKNAKNAEFPEFSPRTGG